MPRGLEPVGVQDQPLAFIDEVEEEAGGTERGAEGGAEVEALLSRVDADERVPATSTLSAEVRRRAFLIRGLALLCACSLSIGSHYASYILGPLKTRLKNEMGTSNTEFSLLISAFSLNSTWTPLVGGLLASRLGTTFTSIIATGAIFLGQILLLIGNLTDDVRLMVFGMFVFGLGVSPLSVVQETIIVRFFKSHGLGVSMALGLVAGKGASFVSARTSYPLTQRFGFHAPFYVATFLAGLSVVVNLIYIFVSKWLVDGGGAELEATDLHEEAQSRSLHSLSEAQALEKAARKRKVKFKEISKLGDVFWSYVGINILCGTLWSPFTHLAANMIQQRYTLTEQEAGRQASYLLAGALILYPICGLVVDRAKNPLIIIKLFLLSSSLTLSCYTWLSLPPHWTRTAWPAIAAFGAGFGFAPLLLVVIVPRIVPSKYISTALGIHKSLEQTGSTIFQTLAGLSLDPRKSPKAQDAPQQSNKHIQQLLNIFAFLNALQLLGILLMGYLDRRQKSTSADLVHRGRSRRGGCNDSELERSVEDEVVEETEFIPTTSMRSLDQERPLLRPELRCELNPRVKKRMKRGEVFGVMCGLLIIFAWILFLGTAWLRLRSKKGRGHET